jgi:hypothetical protein
MRRLLFAAVLVLSSLSSLPLQALHTGGSRVIIPVAGRFAGAGGTQWRTDLFVSNPYSITQTVTVRFYPSGGGTPKDATVTLGPHSAASYPDLFLNTFNLGTAAGTLEVSVPEQRTVEARATIYNSGNPAGQFGQGVPGLDYGYLNRQAYLFGLSGVDGSRVNLGVSNPNDVPVSVQLTLTDANGLQFYSTSVTIPPHSYQQYNDIFTAFNLTPRSGVQASFFGEGLIYGYSSEVRNDTGDAIFNFGISPNS